MSVNATITVIIAKKSNKMRSKSGQLPSTVRENHIRRTRFLEKK